MSDQDGECFEVPPGLEPGQGISTTNWAFELAAEEKRRKAVEAERDALRAELGRARGARDHAVKLWHETEHLAIDREEERDAVLAQVEAMREVVEKAVRQLDEADAKSDDAPASAVAHEEEARRLLRAALARPEGVAGDVEPTTT